MPAIVVMQGKEKGLFLPLGKRAAIIGRDPGAQLQLGDGTVSRKHLQIRFDAERNCYLATDMRSGNGSFVNGNRIFDEVRLRGGDEIRLGDSQLLFTDDVPTDHANAMEILRSAGERERSTIVRSSN
jgi:pSer/pThr/pTyr-binding forkhead associated (FHA) protein